MEKIQLLLEAYSSNKKQYTEDRYFKFLKKIYKAVKSTGALNIGFIYYTLNNNSPKNMDSEFMKMYIDSLTPDNSTLVVMFTEYWNENMGMDLLDGLPVQFNLSIKEEEVFASLIANNDLEKVLKLLDITADRIASITSKCEEDMFYSKCLNDYERNEFKNAVAGLQFFGFSKKEKEEKDRKKFERELYKEMELEYIKDKSNGLYKDIKMLQDEVINSLKKQNTFKIPQDLNKNAIDLTIHVPTGEDINLSNPDKKTLDSIEDNYGKISFLQFDSREGKFSIQKESDYDKEDGWMDISRDIQSATAEAFVELKISDKIDYGDNDSWVEYYINIETLFNLNDKYKKLFEKKAKEESPVAGLQFFGFSKVNEEKMKKAYESLLSRYTEDKNGLTKDLDKLKKAIEQYMKKGKISFSESLMVNFSENMKDVKFTMVDSKTNKEITAETRSVVFLEVNLNGGIAKVTYDQERIDNVYDGDEEYYKQEEESRNIKDIGSDLNRMLDEYFSINSPVILAKNFVSPFDVVYDEENGTEKFYVQLSTIKMLKNNKEYLKLSKEVYKTL